MMSSMLSVAARCVVALVVCGVVSGGCSSGKTTVLAPATTYAASSVTLREGTFTVDEVSTENRGKLRAAIVSRLYQPGVFIEGPDLTLTYAVVQYDKGSRSARYWSSGMSGAGTLTLEAIYADRSGRQLAKVDFEGKVSGGGFGGDFSDAINAVAAQVARYTIDNFAAKKPAVVSNP